MSLVRGNIPLVTLAFLLRTTVVKPKHSPQVQNLFHKQDSKGIFVSFLLTLVPLTLGSLVLMFLVSLAATYLQQNRAMQPHSLHTCPSTSPVLQNGSHDFFCCCCQCILFILLGAGEGTKEPMVLS